MTGAERDADTVTTMSGVQQIRTMPLLILGAMVVGSMVGAGLLSLRGNCVTETVALDRSSGRE